ncbi:hypothetical protein RYA05_19640 [Pseudomonas syringae pv. actinidiae]|uniref:hypothetical protein n=1 Tax=Pseudomonas syringae TaxID=317 RepID=UPI0002094F36|nr:hypothetical protein [Pseudomonas syringae]EPN22830.1 hypothetical protein A259_06121 [Pseudomonas syringae pv. actinidiae ICMP 19070]EPN85660.1 hypothetical protein A234_05822 [Pseudomonas syringae pv. actinidiae ICMP 19101]AKT27969.1 hypothetical protein IYO_000335 [Pseudomonas syringae pv. actinidiae ICMP 18884]AOE54544.1 hypothetical protein NZ708_00335 [Pseudomonas syringae pv. actinidiae ICMP 18708]APP95409.1 hypothetical protein PsaNZ45_00335 [Pseudomonas syringae pv. actinidiae]
MNALECVIGRRVTKACIVHDYVQVYFTGGCILNINNTYEIYGSTISLLKGKELISVLEGEQEIELIFENLAKIRVDMSPDGFHGPEAMELLRPGFPLVIWD